MLWCCRVTAIAAARCVLPCRIPEHRRWRSSLLLLALLLCPPLLLAPPLLFAHVADVPSPVGVALLLLSSLPLALSPLCPLLLLLLKSLPLLALSLLPLPLLPRALLLLAPQPLSLLSLSLSPLLLLPALVYMPVADQPARRALPCWREVHAHALPALLSTVVIGVGHTLRLWTLHVAR